ncbi:hypothetical protein BaRGS_00019648 [Batillaria attramentaria]|uniref:Uncharacterized protein n=1 Tax=Batillaria attramentaria TaxID=370345 RepID=A0ABD0KPR2_9CAEN
MEFQGNEANRTKASVTRGFYSSPSSRNSTCHIGRIYGMENVKFAGTVWLDRVIMSRGIARMAEGVFDATRTDSSSAFF